MKYKIIYGEDYIAIRKGKKEILYWDKQEWIDEPETVFSIVNAVNLACSDRLEEYLEGGEYVDKKRGQKRPENS